MLSKATGIVLHHFSYSNTSVIAKVLTKEYGKQSYMIRGARGKSKKSKVGVLQPLTIAELSMNYREGRSMQTLTEVSVLSPYADIHQNIHKTGIALFYAEVLANALPDNESNPDLFDFVYHTCQLLDHCRTPTIFPLLSLLKLSKFLGFYPNISINQATNLFDMRQGVFVNSAPDHPEYLDRSETNALKQLMGTDFDGMEAISIPHATRQKLLEALVQYYQLHTEGMKQVKSHKILSEVFS